MNVSIWCDPVGPSPIYSILAPHYINTRYKSATRPVGRSKLGFKLKLSLASFPTIQFKQRRNGPRTRFERKHFPFYLLHYIIPHIILHSLNPYSYEALLLHITCNKSFKIRKNPEKTWRTDFFPFFHYNNIFNVVEILIGFRSLKKMKCKIFSTSYKIKRIAG